MIERSPEAHSNEGELVSFVIPTFREYGFGQSLDRLIDYLEALPSIRIEILVVDDSDDETRDQLGLEIDRRSTSLKPGITVRMLSGPRLGKGAAVRLGVQRSTGSVVFVVDADLPVPLHHIGGFLERMRATGADVIVGERPRGRYSDNYLRHVLSRGLWVIQRTLVFHEALFEDTQCGFKCFRGPGLRDIVDLQITDRGMYDLEYLYAATRRGLDVQRVPVASSAEVRPSRINVWRCLLLDPYDILRFKISGLFGRYT
ncbi:MAG: glycosyltransferase [Polyangiaceae bacterium]